MLADRILVLLVIPNVSRERLWLKVFVLLPELVPSRSSMSTKIHLHDTFSFDSACESSAQLQEAGTKTEKKQKSFLNRRSQRSLRVTVFKAIGGTWAPGVAYLQSSPRKAFSRPSKSPFMHPNLACGRYDLAAGNFTQQSFRSGRRINDDELQRFRSSVYRRMVNVRRNINA